MTIEPGAILKITDPEIVTYDDFDDELQTFKPRGAYVFNRPRLYIINSPIEGFIEGAKIRVDRVVKVTLGTSFHGGQQKTNVGIYCACSPVQDVKEFKTKGFKHDKF